MAENPEPMSLETVSEKVYQYTMSRDLEQLADFLGTDSTMVSISDLLYYYVFSTYAWK